MQPQKLCLKWNSHTSNLLSVLGDFQQKDILVDVTISCEGHNIKAHKMILSACSPYFQGIFMENPCQHPVVIMNGMKYEDITAILSFMYKGEVNVSHDGLQSFLHAAETLKVKGLAEVYENEKKSTNSSGQDVQSEQTPQRTDTPSSRRRHRNRKRSLSDSNRSDDEGSSRKQLREPSSPEVHELSGDESFTGDTNSNGPPFNSMPRVPQNMYSRAHQSSSNLADDDDEFEVEPSKLLEQTLTTENVSMSNSSTDKQLRIERIMGNATEIESSSLQEPESPPDIKPIIDYGDSNAGPSDGAMMLYNDQSQPGPSNLQDGSLLHDNSHAQGSYEEATGINARINNAFNHTCETTRLLQELREDPTCFCEISNEDFTDIRTSNGNEIEDFMHRNTKNCPRKNKQLLIINEEGCMRGIEVNKEINSEALSSLNSFHFLNREQENHIIIEDDFESEDGDNSSPLPMEKEENFPYRPRDPTSSHPTNSVSLSSMPQYNPCVSLERLKIRKKRRRHKKKLYFTNRKSKGNPGPAKASQQRDEKPPVSCSVPFKQSYTQVSVEEVHLAQSKRSVGRPRRTINHKSASEMLMLKRKIVQSTSIEYQSNKFHSEQFHSNLAAGVSFNHNFNPRSNGTIAKQHRERGLVRYTRGVRFSRELEKYGPDLVPPGWDTQVVTRKSGKTAGQIDIYFLTPEGKRIRSRAELASYIEKNDLPYMVEEFCFRKSAYH